MQHLSVLMVMFLIVGCQTTQSAETETKPEVVKEVNALPVEKEVPTPEQPKDENFNPFAHTEIPPHMMVTSSKPVICGRIDIMLTRMQEKFGEVPIFMGKLGVETPRKGEKQVVSTMTYNPVSGSYTFLEQMPNEERLMCILSSGHGKINKAVLGTSL